MSNSLPSPAVEYLSEADQIRVLREQLAIARQAFAVIHNDASLCKNQVMQAIFRSTASYALENIDQVAYQPRSTIAAQSEHQT